MVEAGDDTVPNNVPTVERQRPVFVLEERSFDWILFAAVLALLVIGTLEVLGSSAVYALKKHGDPHFFFKRHFAYVVMGLGALWVGSKWDYRWLRRHTYKLLLLSIVLLAAVLVVGATINGASRWFRVGPISFQPVELAKLSLIAYLAYSLAKKADKVKTFTVGFVPHLLVCGVMVLLLLKQPDLGSSIILVTTTFILLFVAGAKVSYIMLALLAAAPVGYWFIVGTPWRLRRIMAYFNPEAFRDGVAYQVIQSRIAIGSGGPTGTGLGGGRQTLGYMPEGHSDFIMSSVGEELGFLGFGLVLVLFGVLLWRGIRAANGSRDVFGSYVAFGICIAFSLQALFNTGVVLGVLPSKGITMPFVSYGGSSLLMSMFLVGVLLNIAMRPLPKPKRKLVNVVVGAKRRKHRAVIK